ncbi:MAG: hypothetical protein SVC26_04335, partial [Pseudomonadota bacterium]|nr:hypothetical protein [Pseudomonadota bacterium]
YGSGINKMEELLTLGVQHDLVEKSGSWYAYGGEKIGQGKNNASNYLLENTAIAEELEQKIRAIAFGLPKEADETAEAE